MITGYNTDVRHHDVVFHVQTEDKGASNPFIESLVYVGGQVLASKRASYAELLASGKDEKSIVALMDHQHRTMIAAIRHGKFDDKLSALTASRQGGAKAAPAPGATAVPAPGQAAAPAAAPGSTAGAAAAAGLAAPSGAMGSAGASAAAPGATVVPPPASSPVATPAGGVRLPIAPPPPPAPRGPERSLDQVILEYLTSEADQEQLVLTLDGEQELRLGGPAVLSLRASSSKTGLPVAGTQISVKMISTVSEPRVLAAGRTDDRGTLRLLFEVPALHRGTAALIISAVSSLGRAELKQLL